MSQKFIDAETMDPDEDLDYTFLVLRGIQRVHTAGSKEFHGGFWQKKPVSVDGSAHIMRYYVEDTRKEYINSVRALRDLLLPELDRDDAYQQREAEIQEELEEERSDMDEDSDKQDKRRFTRRKLELERERYQAIIRCLSRKGWFKTKSKRVTH